MQTGPAPKDSSRRQRRNKKPDLQVVDATTAPPKPEATTPAPRREWLAVTKKRWTQFWESPTAKVIAPALDTAALERLFDLYDERERSYRAFRSSRLVVGSKGQPVLNPIGRALAACDSEIRQLEDRLGLSPMSRLKLGIKLAAGGTAEEPGSLDDLNAQLGGDDEDDPRL